MSLSVKALILALLLGGAGFAFLWGGPRLHVALRDREPTRITCAELAAHPPDASWLALTDCVADVDSYVVEYRGEAASRAIAIYIPLHAKTAVDEPAPVVVKVAISMEPPEDADEDDLYSLANLTTTPSDKLLHRVAHAFEQPIGGVIQTGADLSELAEPRTAGDVNHEIHKLGVGVASDVAVLELGARPNLTQALLVVLLGLGALIGFGVMVRALWRGTGAR